MSRPDLDVNTDAIARWYDEQRFATLAIGAALLLTVVTLACGGSHNAASNSPTATQAASTVAAGAVTPTAVSTSAVGTGTPGTDCATGPQAAATLAPLGTPEQGGADVADKLTPFLLQTSDLPAGERDFTKTGVVPVSNSDYVRGQVNFAALLACLDRYGRLGGVEAQWNKQGGPYNSPSIHSPFAIIDVLSQFKAPDGASNGLALIFSQLPSAAPGTQCTSVNVTELNIGKIGDESRAVGVTCKENVLSGTPTPQILPLTQVFYLAAWRRGPIVVTVELGAINQDPSLDDLKQLVQTQDQRLKSGGL